MKKFFVFSVFLAAVSFFACNKDDATPSITEGVRYHDGTETWEAPSTIYQHISPYVTISGFNATTQEQLVIKINDSLEEGEYTLSVTNTDIDFALSTDGTDLYTFAVGRLTILKNDLDTKEFQATFNCTVQDISNPASTIELNDGEINVKG